MTAPAPVLQRLRARTVQFGSAGFDLAFDDHFFPACLFFGNEGRVFIGCAATGNGAFGGVLGDHIGHLQGLGAFLLQFQNDFGRCACACGDAVPLHGFKILETEFGHGGHIGQDRNALGGAGGQAAQGTALDVGQQGRVPAESN